MRAWRVAQRSTIHSKIFTARAFSTSGSKQSHRSIADRLKHDADERDVTVNGWVRSIRKQKRVAFAAVSDGSTIDSLQAVLKPEDADGYVLIPTTDRHVKLTRTTDFLPVRR